MIICFSLEYFSLSSWYFIQNWNNSWFQYDIGAQWPSAVCQKLLCQAFHHFQPKSVEKYSYVSEEWGYVFCPDMTCLDLCKVGKSKVYKKVSNFVTWCDPRDRVHVVTFALPQAKSVQKCSLFCTLRLYTDALYSHLFFFRVRIRSFITIFY